MKKHKMCWKYKSAQFERERNITNGTYTKSSGCCGRIFVLTGKPQWQPSSTAVGVAGGLAGWWPKECNGGSNFASTWRKIGFRDAKSMWHTLCPSYVHVGRLNLNEARATYIAKQARYAEKTARAAAAAADWNELLSAGRHDDNACWAIFGGAVCPLCVIQLLWFGMPSSTAS